MRTTKKLVLFMSLLLISFFILTAERAFAASLSFEGFSVAGGAEISVPYQANAGTRMNPDTVTLRIDPQASEVVFSLTVSGSGFTGPNCELDWDDGVGAPWPEKDLAVVNGAFHSLETFRFAPSRLNLDASGTHAVLYELDADNEPDGPDLWDAERFLLVTYIGGSSGMQPTASAVSFEAFTVSGGAEIATPYARNMGTRTNPDTVVLRIDPQANEVSFHLTVAGTGFAGPYCQLDWDEDGLGAPQPEKHLTVTNGAFTSMETFRFASSRLNIGSTGARSVLYELEADNEPDSYDTGDAERFLLVTYIGDAANVPTDPANPGSSPDSSGGGGGCNGGSYFPVLLFASLSFFLLHRKNKKITHR